jgi:hypothetical protein
MERIFSFCTMPHETGVTNSNLSSLFPFVDMSKKKKNLAFKLGRIINFGLSISNGDLIRFPTFNKPGKT